MIMPGSKAYDVKCRFCDWKEMIPIRSTNGPFGVLDKLNLPSKCPECGGKVIKQENKMVKF